jgi:integrase
MAIFRRRGRNVWWYEFAYRGRRYRATTGTRSKTLARDIERQRRREVEEAANGIRRPRNAAVLFSVAANEWLQLKQFAWAAKTCTAARLDLAHLTKQFASSLLTDIDVRAVADYVTGRRAEGAAEKTIRNELGTLRALLRHYRLWSALKDDGLVLPRAPEHQAGKALSLDEERRLLHACATSRSRSLYAAVSLALATGLRHDELRLLRWSQVDSSNEAIRVGKSKTAHGAGRAVPLNQLALTALRDWAAQFPDRAPEHYVFPSERVGFSGDQEIPIVFDTDPTKSIGSWKVAWNTARKAAGVLCRWHDMRHTTVTRLLERGVSFAVVAAILGWSAATSVRMAKRYGHIGASPQRDAMKLLDGERAPASATRAGTRPSTAPHVLH